MSKKDRVFFVVFALFLVSCIHGTLLLPAWHWRGLDFQNFYAFHWKIPDAIGRPMIYPPLMYTLMAWVRAFDFYRANLIWSVAIVLLTAAGMFLLADRKNVSTRQFFLGGLLFLQLPMVYAVERGNCDAAIVPIYCGAIVLFARRRFFLSGAVLATACWMKVYPVIPSVILLGACASDTKLRAYFKPLVLGFLAGGVGWAILLFPDSVRYVFEVLPSFASERGGILPTTHILYKSAWAWIFIKLPILFLWGRLTVRHLDRDPILVLSGGLAISTFFQNTSNDYNFVTAYPFLFVAMSRLLREGMRRGEFAVLLLTFTVFVGDRTIWVPIFANRGVLYFQILWLVIFPLFIDRHVDKGRRTEENLQIQNL